MFSEYSVEGPFFSTEGIPQNNLLMWYRVHMERLKHQEVKEFPEVMKNWQAKIFKPFLLF